MLEVFGSWLHLTVDLESYFRILLIQAIPFEWLDLATLFSVWRYILKISTSQFSFKVMVACNSKTTDQKLLGRD